MSKHAEPLVALIPTGESDLYGRFGLDIVHPAQWDDEGICTREMEPVVWLELGQRFGDLDDEEVRDTLDDLATEGGYRLCWETLRPGSQFEFAEVEVEHV